jgi:hypothetical protein
MRICPVVTESFLMDKWMDRRTHMMKLIVAVQNFMNMTKNDKFGKIIVAKNGLHQDSRGRLIATECGIHENQNTKQEMLIQNCGFKP